MARLRAVELGRNGSARCRQAPAGKQVVHITSSVTSAREALQSACWQRERKQPVPEAPYLTARTLSGLTGSAAHSLYARHHTGTGTPLPACPHSPTHPPTHLLLRPLLPP